MDIKTLLELKSIYEKRRGYVEILVKEQKAMVDASVTTYDKAERTIRLLEVEIESKTLGFAIATIDEQIRRVDENKGD